MDYRTARLILGTNASSTYTDIKRAFRRLAIEKHPDRNHSPHAIRDFTNLRLAYECLMNHRSQFQTNRYKKRERRKLSLQRRIYMNKDHEDPLDFFRGIFNAMIVTIVFYATVYIIAKFLI